MKLPFSKLFEKKEKPEFYLAFLLRHEKVIAVIFEQLGTAAKVIGEGEAYFEKNIEEANFEELLSVSDKAISKAEENVPGDSGTLKTLFGLKDGWITEDRIKKEYLERLKKISDELGLSPIGFITITEAITNLLKKEEGIPLSAILAEVGKAYVSVSLVKAGKILETKSSEIHENPAFTADVLLKHLEIPDVLPSKVILYNGEDEDLTQKFIHHKWSKALPFLHLPQIISLPKGFDAKAILQGAASKMGFEIISEGPLKTLGEREEIPSFKKMEYEEETSPKREDEDEHEEKKEEKEEEINFVENEDSIEKFGFIENEDVVSMPPPKKDIEEDDDEEKEEKKEELKIHQTPLTAVEQHDEYEDEEEEYSTKRKSEKNVFTKILSSIPLFFSSFFKNIKFPKNKGVLLFLKNKFIAIPVLIILIIIAIYIISFFTLKTEVVLTLNPKLEEEKQDVTFSAETTDVDEKIIFGKFIETSLEDSVSTSTTGKKETGEKAKGEVTVYSRFTSKKTINKGTVLTSSNDLDFVLDEDVNIASSSADASEDPATAKGKVTAKNIGKESNLPSGAKFSVGNLSSGDIIAKNESAFSGGTKKEITIVSEEDNEKLLTEIVEKLKKEALEELTKKIDTEKEVLLPAVISSSVEKESFDKKVGDEASKLNLKATVLFQGLSYKKDDLISFTKSFLDKELLGKMEIDEKNIQVDVEDIKEKDEKDDTVSATLKIKAPLLPSLKKEELAKNISGKSKEEAKNTLLNISQVVDVDINPSFPIPFLTNYLPKFSNNIKIVTKINE